MTDVQTPVDPQFNNWLSELEKRHLSELEFSEVRRGLQALSGGYVHRRDRRGAPRRGVAFDGRGKRAAFALFYAPLHFLTLQRIVDELQLAGGGLREIVDLGCGTGAGAAAWSLGCAEPRPRLLGIDVHPWAVEEARWNWRRLGLVGTARRGNLLELRLGVPRRGIVAAYVANELDPEARVRLLEDLLVAGRQGARVLVVEPIARRVSPWWNRWAEAFEEAGGRADTWRFECRLPETLHRLDRAAGMDHRELTARTLSLAVTAEDDQSPRPST